MPAYEVMDCLHLPGVTSADIPTSDYAVRSRAFLGILPSRKLASWFKDDGNLALEKIGEVFERFRFVKKKKHLDSFLFAYRVIF